MSVLEIIVVSAFAIGFIYILYAIYSPKKKKEKKPKEEKKKEEKPAKAKTIKGEVKKDDNNLMGKAIGEKKIEPAIKKGETPPPQEEEEEQELVLKKDPPPKEPEPFRIIRKQSKVKISKQALKAGSRNPSVTKVFDKGKRIDIDENSNGGLMEDAGKEIAKVVEEINKESDAMSDIISQDIGHYGVREPNFDSVSSEHEFKINAPKGSPNRAPIIGDRTHFASHLMVTDDNNLSGVMGTGVAKIIEKSETQAEKIDQNTEEMVRNVKRDLLGDMPKYSGLFDHSSFNNTSGQKNDASQKLKDIDAETLIIAQAISKRKGNPKN